MTVYKSEMNEKHRCYDNATVRGSQLLHFVIVLLSERASTLFSLLLALLDRRP